MILGRDKAIKIVQKAVENPGADMIQASLSIGEYSLTRFANSIIHQNVYEKNARLSVKAVAGKRIGYASTNKLDDESVRNTSEKALRYAQLSQENKDFVSLPKAKTVVEVDTYDPVTAEYSPENRGITVADMIEEAAELGAVAAGSYSTGYQETAIANSFGIASYNPCSIASVNAVMTAATGYGYADQVAQRVKDLDPIAVAAEAASRSRESMNPETIEPGEYTVILLPYAVAELMGFLAYLGFGALAVQEGRSFMTDKLGQKIMGDNITIWDDGLDPRGIPQPFDAEGVPKQRVDLIKNGIANAVVYDSYTAHKEGKESTGHAVSMMTTHGPMPVNLFMQTGDQSVTEMILNTKRGILVTRFHYTNVIHPIRTIITGMTRDGTFLIEKGMVVKPLKNLRFTDSIIERLSNVEAISRETMRQRIGVIPAIKTHGFRFTGATEF